MSIILDEAFRQQARVCHEQAQSEPLLSGSGLTIGHLSEEYDTPVPVWAVGPFHLEPLLTFQKSRDWADPLEIGWGSSTFLWNPTVIEHHGALHLFYRAGPRKESLSSRIGLAVWRDRRWTDYGGNPVIYPRHESEVFGCEDPKIYKADDVFYLFYNGVYPLAPQRGPLLRGERFEASLGCDINLAVSRDLVHWERLGLVVPHEVSRFWAKGAVIGRNGAGEAVRWHGQYVMFISEGCGNQQYLGFSKDLVQWTFEPRTFLTLPAGWGRIHEVACVIVNGSQWVMDVYYRTLMGEPAACQVLYDPNELTTPQAFHRGGTLAWGGLITFHGQWLLAQGWDANPGTQAMYFYTAPRTAPDSISGTAR